MSTIATAVALIPDIVRGIKEGAEIIERIQAGDMTAEQQALDWLGVTAKVDEADKNWEASKTSAGPAAG